MNKLWKTTVELVGGRKFLVFLTATGLLISKLVSAEIWLWVAAIYVGGNVIELMVTKLGGK